MRKFLISILASVVLAAMLLSACAAPVTISPTPAPTPAPSPTHSFSIVDIVDDSQYWNAAWDATELYRKLWSINKSYRETHTYIEGVFDCDDMTIDL